MWLFRLFGGGQHFNNLRHSSYWFLHSFRGTSQDLPCCAFISIHFKMLVSLLISSSGSCFLELWCSVSKCYGDFQRSFFYWNLIQFSYQRTCFVWLEHFLIYWNMFHAVSSGYSHTVIIMKYFFIPCNSLSSALTLSDINTANFRFFFFF